MTPLGRYVVETFVTLLGVVGLAVLVLYATRRLGAGRPHGPLSLVGRLLLDARRSVYLVKVGETFYVLGASEAGLTKLGEVAAAELGDLAEATGPVPSTPSFKDFLERLQKKPESPKRSSPEGTDGR